MDAFAKIAKIKDTGLKPWKATLYIDHYLAEPVLVGGARRSARMSTKDWRDPDIIEFIGVKRPVEYNGMTMDQVMEYRKKIVDEGGFVPMSFLWSSNNSIAADDDFYKAVAGPITADPLTQHAKMAFEYACQCGYADGTGEPGFVNVHKIEASTEGLNEAVFEDGEYFGSKRYKVEDDTKHLMTVLYHSMMEMPYQAIVNPCAGSRHG